MFERFKKVLFLLSSSEKKELLGVFVLSFIMTVLDSLGVLSIFPFLNIVINPSLIQTNKWLKLVYAGFGFTGNRSFLIAMGAALLVFFIVANFVKGYALWKTTKFSLTCNRRISVKLLMIYFNDNYLDVIKKNSAQITNHLLSNVDLAISGVLMPFVSIFTNSILVLLMLGILFLTQPSAALISMVAVGILYYVVDRVIKKRIEKLGSATVRNSTYLYKHLNEATGGIKEIKYLGREKKFLDAYDECFAEYVNLKSDNNLYSSVPKLVIDTLAYSVGIIIVIFVLGAQGNFTDAIPWMGLFGFVILKLVPSSQAILLLVSKIRYSNNALDLIFKDFEINGHLVHKTFNKSNERMSFNKIIEFKDVSFSYSNHSNVLDYVNFVVKKGEMVAFVGRTGAGKTTIIDLMLGLIQPGSGQILIDQTTLVNANASSWQKNIGYVPQSVYLADDSILNNVAFGFSEKDIDKEKVIDACKRANIHEFITTKLPNQYETRVGERGIQISGGQRQRLGIARALYHNPDVIILDEATSALDNQTEDNVMDEIAGMAGTKTIIIIAHRLSTVEKCNTIFLLDHGKLVSQGSFQEMLVKEPDFFSRVGNKELKRDHQ